MVFIFKRVKKTSDKKLIWLKKTVNNKFCSEIIRISYFEHQICTK